jgi:hypothetical protein
MAVNTVGELYLAGTTHFPYFVANPGAISQTVPSQRGCLFKLSPAGDRIVTTAIVDFGSNRKDCFGPLKTIV